MGTHQGEATMSEGLLPAPLGTPLPTPEPAAHGAAS